MVSHRLADLRDRRINLAAPDRVNLGLNILVERAGAELTTEVGHLSPITAGGFVQVPAQIQDLIQWRRREGGQPRQKPVPRTASLALLTARSGCRTKPSLIMDRAMEAIVASSSTNFVGSCK